MAFDFQPSLMGTLLRLRPLRADDFGALHAAAADPGIWEQHPDKDRYREDVFRPFFDEQLASREALVVIDAVTGDLVGMSRFHGYDADRSEVSQKPSQAVHIRRSRLRQLRLLGLMHIQIPESPTIAAQGSGGKQRIVRGHDQFAKAAATFGRRTAAVAAAAQYRRRQ